MVVECGNITVKLTTRLLLIDEKLCDILEKIENNDCGGDYVYQEISKILEHKFGPSAIDLYRKNFPLGFLCLQSEIMNKFQSKLDAIYFDLEGTDILKLFSLKKKKINLFYETLF
jgi:hypothetical protein